MRKNSTVRRSGKFPDSSHVQKQHLQNFEHHHRALVQLRQTNVFWSVGKPRLGRDERFTSLVTSDHTLGNRLMGRSASTTIMHRFNAKLQVSRSWKHGKSRGRFWLPVIFFVSRRIFSGHYLNDTDSKSNVDAPHFFSFAYERMSPRDKLRKINRSEKNGLRYMALPPTMLVAFVWIILYPTIFYYQYQTTRNRDTQFEIK